MTEYPTSQEGPQPVASAGGTDEAGHGKAPIAATEAVRTHATGAGTGPAAEPGAAAAAAAAGGQFGYRQIRSHATRVDLGLGGGGGS
ncbi:hypothetical protein ACFXC7_37670, partial [Streptomyces virginiae]